MSKFDFSEIFKKTEKKLNSLRKNKGDEYAFRTLDQEPALFGINWDAPHLERLFTREFFAFGRCGLLVGKRGGGKSSLTFHAMKRTQEQGGFVVLIESEHALDLDYMQLQGVDLTKVIIHHPHSAEESVSMILSYADTLNDTEVPVMLCLDSLGAQAADIEIEEELNKAKVGGRHAQLYAQFYRQLVPAISATNMIFIGVNQQKDQIVTGFGGGFGPPQPALLGGDSQKFASTHQLIVSRTKDLTAKNQHGKDVKVGSQHKAIPWRNKLGSEGNSMAIEYDAYANGGLDFYTPMIRSLGDEFESNPLIRACSSGFYKCIIPGIKYLVQEEGKTVEKEIPADKPTRASTLGVMFSTSAEGKAKCREIFGIKPAAAPEEVAAVDAENKTIREKRKKRKTEVAEETL